MPGAGSPSGVIRRILPFSESLSCELGLLLASPSGLAVTDEGVYLAGLRGERLWRAPLRDDGVGKPQALLTDLGRLRAVVEAPDGSLWVMTNNTDGRGDPRGDDDRIVRIEVG